MKKSWNRKGISPLIATVLLFAFAVALSTMVVSYLLEATRTTPCDKASVGVDSSLGICYTDGHVDFVVVNTAQDQSLTGVKVLITSNAAVEEVQLAIPLEPGSASKASIPYSAINPASLVVSLIPIVNDGTGDKFCVPQQTKAPVRVC